MKDHSNHQTLFSATPRGRSEHQYPIYEEVPESLLQTILENVEDGIAVLNPEGKFVCANVENIEPDRRGFG